MSPRTKLLVRGAEPVNAALLVTELQALGYEVSHSAASPEQDASLAAQLGNSLVVLDLSAAVEPALTHDATHGIAQPDADRYRDLVENSYDLICTHDVDGTLLSVNAAAEKALGYPRDALVGRQLQDLLVPDTRHLFSTYLAEILDKGSAHGVMRMRAASGDVREWEYHNSERRLDDGRHIIRGLAHDVTEQLRAVRELRASEQRFRALFEQAAVGVAYIDTPTGKLLEVNHKCAQILGYAHEELVTLSFEQLIHPGDLVRYEQRMAQLAQGAVSEFVLELRLLGHEGAEVWVALSVSPLLRDGARSSKHIAVVQDIGERKVAEKQRAILEAQLRQAQKMEAIGTLAGGIAHDFNNLLTTMTANVEVARLDVEPTHSVVASLDAIAAATRRATDLVRQILTFSRKQSSLRSVTALAPVIADSVRLLRASLPAAVSIEFHVEDNAPLVMADPTQIHQVVMNLCTNAWQAIRGERGRIDVTLDAFDAGPAAGRFARIRVRDTGEGMDARTLERIFEPFFTTKTAGRGSGLGLSVAHGIVKEHGGTIMARSRAGEGATFEVLIPAADAKAVAAAVAGESEVSAPLFGYGHVLYIDDEKSLASAVARMVESLGYRATVCHSGAEALAQVRESPQAFDVVLTDLSMPGLSGTDVARELMRLRPGLPVILTSGYPDRVTQDLASLGIRMRLDKPFDRRALGEALNKVLGSSIQAAG
ncbi:MAG: PAS domain S-box protein [Gammaproteobacteria bacterium]